MPGLTKSSFNKWRCLIALAHVDGRLDPAEKAFFQEQLKSLDGETITIEQMNTLVEDLKNPKDPEVFFFNVEDRLDKIDLLRLAYYLFWSDGEFDPREKKMFENLKRSISGSLQIQEEVLEEFSKMKDTQKVSLKDIIASQIEKEMGRKSSPSDDT